MKTQQLTLIMLALLISLSQVILTSCSGSNKVVSSFFIQKRKYTKGYHFDLAAKKNRRRSAQELIANRIEGRETNVILEKILCADGNLNDEQAKINVGVQASQAVPKYLVKRTRPKEIYPQKRENEISSTTEEALLSVNESKICNENINANKKVKNERQVNGFAIAGFCFGILGMFFALLLLLGASWLFFFLMPVCAVLALVFGIRGLAKRKKSSGKMGGENLSIAAIAMGGLLIIAIASIVLEALSSINLDGWG
jgi:hypothetical protein